MLKRRLQIIAAILFGALALFSFSNASAQSQFTAVSDGGDTLCGLVDDGSVICNASSRVVNRTPPGLPPAIDVVAGLNAVCAILEGGELTCWGSNVHGLLEFPTGQAPYKSVSLSDNHACVINNTGAIECWGNDGNNRLVAPEGEFVSLAVGEQQGCAVDVNNRVACWGSNDQGTTDVPDSLPDALMVDSSFATSCAVTTDQEIRCWGRGLIPPQGLFTEVQVWASGLPDSGRTLVCGLHENGELDCVRTVFGQTVTFETIAPPQGTRVTNFHVFGSRVCYVDDEGVIDCLGNVSQEIPVIGDNMPVPATTGLRADVYSTTTIELFWDDPRDAFNVAGHEIIRNGEVYAFTPNASSFLIDDLDPNEQTTFAVQRVSIEDQRGPASDTITVNTDGGSPGGGEINSGDYQPPARPFEPAGLEAFVYGDTAIELVWDRVNASQISGYEIRRDGVFVGFTNGVSFFEELSVGDKAFRYDVIPVNRDDPSAFFGFSSITVGADGGLCR